MDIEFIEQKYRDDIFKLMELCGLDMAQAYELYANANFSFEGAMQKHFNQGSEYDQGNLGQGHYESNQGSYGAQYNQNIMDDNDDQFQSLYQKYKVYKSTGIKFETNYEVRKEGSFLGGLVPKFFKGTPQSNFKKLLQKYFERPCPIQFAAGSLSSVLVQSQKFPVIAYVLDFSPAAKAKVQQILRSNQFSSVVNQQFKNFGIDPGYIIEKSLQKFVDRKKYNNTLVVMRVNAVQQIQILCRIQINKDTIVKQVTDKLRLAKNNSISKDLDDVHLERRLHQELMGNFDYQKPMSIAQKRKMAQDRQIKKKQQEQFFASMKADQQKQRKKSQNIQNQPTHKPTQTHQPKQQTKYQMPKKQAPKKQQPKRNIAEQRKILRQKLKTYTQGMNIRLRLPNGEAIVVTVDINEKGQYLYDYVLSIDRDIGFERDASRNFHLIRPYDKLNLSQIKNQTLNQIFQGSDSQNLAVTEI